MPAPGKNFNGFKRGNPDNYEIDPNGCWIWQGYINSNGYGYVRGPASRKSQFAHRWHYEQVHGVIPERHEVHHTCRVRACVNPDHLVAVTRREHSRLAPGAKLDYVKAQRIRELHARGESKKELARRFGVSYRVISNVINGLAWKSIPRLVSFANDLAVAREVLRAA